MAPVIGVTLSWPSAEEDDREDHHRQSEMNMKDVSGKVILKAGWSDFAVAHKLKIGYMLFFKKLSARDYKVVVFDYSCCEVVDRCPQHPKSTRRLQEDEE
jgi:hypothetical protein